VSQHHYCVYGVSLQSDMAFDLPAVRGTLEDRPRVRFARACSQDFAAVSIRDSDDEDFTCRALEDASVYLRWQHLFEFLIDPSGATVRYRPLRDGNATVLQNFLFGQALAFALIRQGIEAIHAAVVDLGGFAIALLGDCTYGKSTLAGALIRAGGRLVSDDVLVVHASKRGMLARAGAGRIKLRPDSAAVVLPGVPHGVRIIPHADKRVLRLPPDMIQGDDVPLRAFAVLPTPGQRDACAHIDMRRVTGARVFHELVKNTFVRYLDDAGRLEQNFSSNADLAAAIPGYQLSYPSGIDRLPSIAEATIDFFRTLHTRNDDETLTTRSSAAKEAVCAAASDTARELQGHRAGHRRKQERARRRREIPSLTASEP